ncbi:MAG TPA: hypothetical protein PLL00_07395 [Bacteroidia bacterium]|nr:hypothetical protein [Bacteroidia bacterium]
MRLTKSIIFFFSFLFITVGINGKNQNHAVQSVVEKIQSAPCQDQLHQATDGVIVCFRLTENTNSFFRSSEQINPFFDVAFNKQQFFSKRSYVCYSIKRLNQLDSCLLYIHHRRFRI